MSWNPAPEGRPSLAQRFSAGKSEGMIQVPEGRPNPGVARNATLSVQGFASFSLQNLLAIVK